MYLKEIPCINKVTILYQRVTCLIFRYIFCNSTASKLIIENVWKNWGFLKTDHVVLCTPDLVYCFFELISYSFQRESIKYMNIMNSRIISWLWFLIQMFWFPAILPWLPMMQLWAWTPLCWQSTAATIEVSVVYLQCFLPC